MSEVIDVSKAGNQTRTREQCQAGLLRFHPSCNFYDVLELLREAGYKISRTKDGILWIEKA